MVIDTGRENETGVVVNQGGDIALDFGPVLSNRQLHDIFNVCLGQHHPVGFAETL